MAPSAVNPPVSAAALDHLPVKLANKASGQNGTTNDIQLADVETTDLVLRTFRCLIADLCEQFKGGHPGGAMGMAAIGVALWKYVMRYSPENPNFFNRDRFVLSNGHTCLWQYTFMHLVGYKNMTLEQLKSYHSTRTDSICPGHPEIEHEGIEVTTGPLGQGIANAVGLAMATKHLAATYNKPGFEVVNNKTWCMVGDACLQEGVGLEAISLAGHWRLDNLIVVYDNNQITCDGSVDLANTEDVNAKMTASGWEVLEVADGNNDVEGVVAALVTARSSSSGKPVFVNIKTTIGVGSKVAGDAKAHGAAFGAEEVANIKKAWNFNPEEHFVVSDTVYDFFREVKTRGRQFEKEWQQLLVDYGNEYPDLASELALRIKGEFTGDWAEIIPAKEDFPTAPTASRKSAGLVCNPLAAMIKNFMVGTADLSPSVNMIWKDKVDFQHPDLRPTCGITGNYTGRYIHWGIREHAMAAISNGLAAFNKGTILPVTSSFFMFYLVSHDYPSHSHPDLLLLTTDQYAAPAVRMGALQRLQTIHIATHDSIGTGEDGPTHQPIELAALYRAMPNLLYIRPADSEETAGAFMAALSARSSPSIISLSRHNLAQYPEHSSRDGVLKGAYVFIEDEAADVTLIGVGSELGFAVRARSVLGEKYGLKARVVSFPCQRLFERQSREYKASVLQYRGNVPRVVIEAYAVNGWERYADAGYSMSSFGHSLPGKAAYDFFGFEEGVIAERVKEFVEEVKKVGVEGLRGEFRDLNVREH
ncbi:Transketolase, thiamine diphosphate binding domain-containing protein [Chaetomium sp. MPI-CAGE-AT-0009]|nr:Transketolase, thiamine diphosphate binding domain-containing protein [Chaetomium sp. MPI-CAGE-AT-0009]